MGHDPLHEMGRLARSRKVFLWILSASVGALLGYLLLNPLFSLPPELKGSASDIVDARIRC